MIDLFPGSELYHDRSQGPLARWYCRLFGVPIIGLRIRLRRISKLLPDTATTILDAGCGRGVITRLIAGRYADATIDAVDDNAKGQEINRTISQKAGFDNIDFITSDLRDFTSGKEYDLIVSVDNLEHIENDIEVMTKYCDMMKPGGLFLVHVPHYHRRWPLFKKEINFDVPGHVRPGYTKEELEEKVKQAGFVAERSGYSYGFVENMVNNLSYMITKAEERNKEIYALLFPFMNVVAWFGQFIWPDFGAGVWVVARKPE